MSDISVARIVVHEAVGIITDLSTHLPMSVASRAKLLADLLAAPQEALATLRKLGEGIQDNLGPELLKAGIPIKVQAV